MFLFDTLAKAPSKKGKTATFIFFWPMKKMLSDLAFLSTSLRVDEAYITYCRVSELDDLLTDLHDMIPDLDLSPQYIHLVTKIQTSCVNGLQGDRTDKVKALIDLANLGRELHS